MLLASVTGTLVDAVGSHGLVAVLLILAVDAVLPAGGEITMLFAGALASGALGRHTSAFGVDVSDGLPAYLVLATGGTVGYLLGSLAGWEVGRRGGSALIERYGRWLHLGPSRMARAERWFDRFGRTAVLLGRLTPLVRSFISIPAGVLRSPLVPYTLLTTVGSAIWCFGLAAVGWALGTRYEDLHGALRYVDDLAALGLVALVVVAAVGWARTRKQPVT